MDNTRYVDLGRLHKVFNDPLENIHTRRIAYRSFNRILRHLKDKKLSKLRHRLVRAQLAGDSSAADRLTLQISDYSERKGY